jgi:hypothetical protein
MYPDDGFNVLNKGVHGAHDNAAGTGTIFAFDP